MVLLTGTNSLSSLIAIIAVIWYLISGLLLQRHYIQNYTKSVKSRINSIFVIGKLMFTRGIKDDAKLNTLIWHTRISILIFIIGIALTMI